MDTQRALLVQLATGGIIWNKMKTIRGDCSDNESEEDSDARLVEKAQALLCDVETKKHRKK